MKRIIILLLFISILLAQTPTYKSMMTDMSINFYTVCDSADAYFANRDKGKGSGYKPFLRWKHENESKYYPSGNRNVVDETMPYQEYLRIKSESFSSRLFETGGWNYLGPNSIDSITGHYAAGIGRVEYVLVNPSNANQIYMGSRSGGLWRTNNEGATWIHHTDFLPASGVNAISANPSNFNEVYINVRIATNGTSFGIYKSTDGGITFAQTPFNPANLGFGGLGSNFQIHVIKHHPNVPGLVFVGTDRGIFRSTDNLNTWVRTNNSWNVVDIEFHPTNNNIIYVHENYYWGVNRNRIQKSIDQGLTYTPLTNLPGNGSAQINITVPTTCPNCIYATSDNGIYISNNEGTSFTTRVNPAPAGVSLWYATPNMLDTTKIVGGYVDIFRSNNGGGTFTKATYWSLGSVEHGPGDFQQRFNNSLVYVHADCNYMTNVNGVFYACTDGYLAKSSDNGNTWTKLSLEVGTRENYCLGASQSNHDRTICGYQDNGTSVKNENGWLEIYGADGMEGIIHPLNHNWMIGSFQNGGRQRTTDGGANTSGVSPGGHTSSWIAPMAYDPNNHMTVYHFGTIVHKSTDFGNTWTNLGGPTTFTGSTIHEAEIAQNNSQIMVITRNEKIELSINGGISFTDIRGTLPNLSISDVAFDPLNDNTIIVTYNSYSNDGNKVFITHNLGTTWTNITSNLGNMPIDCSVIDHSDSSYIYLGAKIGVYRKSMNGTVWQLYNTDLPNVSIEDMEVCWGSNTIKAATWGRGLWEYSLLDRNTFPAITRTQISSDVTWDAPKETVEQIVTSTIQYSGTLTSVFVKWSLDSTSFHNTITMSNTTGTTWVANASLPTGPVYANVYFKVYAVGNAGDTTETYKFMYTIQPYEYCTGIGSSADGNLYIRRFQLSNVDNFNDVNSIYINYGSLPVTLWRDSSYTVDLLGNTGWSDNDYSVYIDYNNDASFNIPSERVVYDMNSTSTGTGTFTVPMSVTIDDTLRLRARVGYWGNTFDPCIETLGEVEDYPVIIKAAPILTLNGGAAYCFDDTINLSYSGEGVDSLHWEISDGITTYTYSGNTVNNLFPTGTYSINLYGYKYGMEFTEVFLSYFTVTNTLNVEATPDTAICIGESLTVSVSGATAFMWNNGLGAGATHTVTPTVNTTYIVTGSSGSCISSDTVSVVVNALPIITFNIPNDTVCINLGNINLSASPSGGMYYGSGVTGSVFNTATAGIGAHSITYSYTNTDNCTSEEEITLYVIGCAGIDSDEFSFSVFPNPTQNIIHIQSNVQDFQVELVDVLGRLLKSEMNASVMDISQYSNGTYLLKINYAGKTQVLKIMKN